MAKNHFQNCSTIEQVIAQAVGAGSTCWVGGTGDAQFDSAKAVMVSDDAIERVMQIFSTKKENG